MSTHKICFCGEVRKKNYVATPSYLELCILNLNIEQKSPFEYLKTGVT